MDPAKSPLNQSQTDRLNSIMNTPAAPSTPGQNQAQTQTQPPTTTQGSSPTNQQTSPSNQSSTQPNQPPSQSVQPTVSPGSLGSTTPINQPQPPIGGVSSQATNTPLGQSPASPLGQPAVASQPTTYQAPTIGITPEVGGLSQASTPQSPTVGPELKPSKNKPMKVKGGFPSTILYVVGGIILLVVYTVIWAVVFDLKLPFGITLPF